ncbi:MAG: adenylyltransferase/cytidyltransferase family protein [Flavobacteriaceae bacterium]|jgi:cytidyltransferase-like protein|nr:adenylyltransferase/cytidyltransferase family protein [Flavobacteriaceae bacterium]
MKKKVIIVSGYFNPLHKGHIEYFKNAKNYGDALFVIVNNDYQRKLKGSKEFMDEKERLLIIDELKITDKTFLSIDNDRTVSKSIEKIHREYSSEFDLCFANGGDQTNDSIPEASICAKLNINLIDGLGNKIQSSSWLLKE